MALETEKLTFQLYLSSSNLSSHVWLQFGQHKCVDVKAVGVKVSIQSQVLADLGNLPLSRCVVEQDLMVPSPAVSRINPPLAFLCLHPCEPLLISVLPSCTASLLTDVLFNPSKSLFLKHKLDHVLPLIKPVASLCH